MRIALCGCMMQEADEVERIRKSYSFVDLVFGTHNIYKLAELLYTQVQSARPVMDVWKEAKEIVEDLMDGAEKLLANAPGLLSN